MCLLYTPANEHFGIVPLEAGLLGTPVIACDSGGPLETIVDGKTGFLRAADPKQWAEAVKRFLDNPNLSISMGKQGHNRVKGQFSLQKMISELNDLCIKNS